jgi:hypothetical protein
MNIDCKWIDKNLEALCSGTLTQEDQERAQHHIENCGPCGKEVTALSSIDPLVKRYFEGELDRVRRGSPRIVAKGRLVALSSVALIVACLLIAATLRTSHQNPAISTIPLAQTTNSRPPLEASPSVKNNDITGSEIERAKPLETAPDAAAQTPRVLTIPNANAPDFMVTDPAGYSRTLDDYRGHVFVLGILKEGQRDAASNLERLYKAFGTNPKFRFLAVSNERQLKPANTTFPIAYNHGSKLFGALPGDFVLLNEEGSTQLRGSLVKDFDNLQKALHEK